MSVQAVAWVLDNSPSKGNQRCVLIAIANRFDPKEPLRCWPRLEVIASEANVSVRTAQRCIGALQERGELVVQERQGGSDGLRADRRPNRYLMPGLVDVAALSHEVTDSHPAPPPQGSPIDPPRGDRSRTDGVTLLSPDTSLIPSVEKTLASTSSPRRLESVSTRRRDELWEAVLSVCGLAGAEPTKSERGAWNAAVKQLRDAGAEPSDVARRGTAYRRRWPSVSLTPTALARHWNECAAKVSSATGTEGAVYMNIRPPGPAPF